jgi:hypothetical protein
MPTTSVEYSVAVATCTPCGRCWTTLRIPLNSFYLGLKKEGRRLDSLLAGRGPPARSPGALRLLARLCAECRVEG